MSPILHIWVTSVHYNTWPFLVCAGNHRSLCLHGTHFTVRVISLAPISLSLRIKLLRGQGGNDDNDKPTLRTYWAPGSGLQTLLIVEIGRATINAQGPNSTCSEVGEVFLCPAGSICNVLGLGCSLPFFPSHHFHAVPSSIKQAQKTRFPECSVGRDSPSHTQDLPPRAYRSATCSLGEARR